MKAQRLICFAKSYMHTPQLILSLNLTKKYEGIWRILHLDFLLKNNIVIIVKKAIKGDSLLP